MEMLMTMEEGPAAAMESKELAQQNIKGRRIKRQRPTSPLILATKSVSSSNQELTLSSSPSTSFESSEEEEDMANCLILLAQGNVNVNPSSAKSPNNKSSSHHPVAAAAASAEVGLYVYPCKTCNRCFSSFQALGGHRASHKKPKASNDQEIKKPPMAIQEMDQDDQFHDMNTTLSLQIPNRGLCGAIKANKVHECAICGAEFSSGQALGGHMRRHRAFTNTSTAAPTMMSLCSHDRVSQQSKKPRNNALQLDLNLPAPEDDLREHKFQFASKEQVLVFSISSLVDCHY